MVCIYCGGNTHVTNSRLQKKANNVWRRRSCADCGAIYSSIEQPDFGTSLVVRTGTRTVTPFSRDVLFISIYESCKHRRHGITDAEALCRTIITSILAQSKDGAIDRATLVECVATILHRFDKAAATMYRAYHPTNK